MIQVLVKEYDGWWEVIDTADQYGILDYDEVQKELDEVEATEPSYRCNEFWDGTEAEALIGLAKLGVVYHR